MPSRYICHTKFQEFRIFKIIDWLNYQNVTFLAILLFGRGACEFNDSLSNYWIIHLLNYHQPGSLNTVCTWVRHFWPSVTLRLRNPPSLKVIPMSHQYQGHSRSNKSSWCHVADHTFSLFNFTQTIFKIKNIAEISLTL